MTPHERRTRPRSGSEILMGLLVAVLGGTLGAGGVALLGPLGTGPALVAGPSATGAVRDAAAPYPRRLLSASAVYARVEPSVVDVTATLGYEGETAAGTGLVINPRAALVLTNNHVVRGSTAVSVTLPGTGRSYPASIVGVDVAADIAVLRLRPVPGLRRAPLGDSATVHDGMRVVAIGNRAGADGVPALLPGVISGTGKTIQAADSVSGFTETLHGMLATTAKIEPGDSGGPLADAAGKVIGIDTAAGTGDAAPGYAIGIDTALAIARRIDAGRPWPGVTFGTAGFLGAIVGSTAAASPRAQAAQERKNESQGTEPAYYQPQASCLPTRAGVGVPAQVAPAPSGALVDGVLCGTAAASTPITAGDVIIGADGRPVSSAAALTAAVARCHAGATIAVTWVDKDGTVRTARVRLGPAPTP